MVEAPSEYQKEVAELFKKGRVKPYPKNQLIYYQDDELTQIYLVKDGYVKVYTILDSGDTRTLLILGPGDIFPIAFSGTMEWENYRLKYFYQSLTDTTLQGLHYLEFKKLVEGSTEYSNLYLAYMAASNEVIMQQLEIMKSKKAINKVVMLLPYLISKLGERIRPGAYRLRIKLSHQEIADLSGVTRETTTTLVKKLEKQGRLEQKKGRLIIHTKVHKK